MASVNIELNNSDSYYQPGSVVEGEVTIVTEYPEDYEQVKIRLLGESVTNWSDCWNVYNMSENSVDLSNELWTKELAPDDDGKFPVGEKRFPFSFSLPLNIPSSFESSMGKVHYKIELNILNHYKITKTLCTKELIVKEIIYHGDDPLLQDSVLKSETQVMTGQWCCISFQKTEIVLSVSISRLAFVVGDSVPYTISISNRIPRKAVLEISINRRGTYTKSIGRMKDSTNYYVRLFRIESCDPPFKYDGEITLPKDLVLMENRSLISLKYYFTASLKIRCEHDMKIEIPLTIGNSHHKLNS